MKSVSSPASWTSSLEVPWSTDRLFFRIAKAGPVESVKFCDLALFPLNFLSPHLSKEVKYHQVACYDARLSCEEIYASVAAYCNPLWYSNGWLSCYWAFWASFAEYFSANWPISIWFVKSMEDVRGAFFRHSLTFSRTASLLRNHANFTYPCTFFLQQRKEVASGLFECTPLCTRRPPKPPFGDQSSVIAASRFVLGCCVWNVHTGCFPATDF